MTVFGLMTFLATLTTDWFILATTESAYMTKTLADIAFDDAWFMFKSFSDVFSLEQTEFVSYCGV